MACLSCTDQLQKQRMVDKLITRQLKEEKKTRDEENRRKLVVLLLGTSGSGKTTLMKQTRVITGKGFSKEDRRSYVRAIRHNVLIAIQSLVHGMDELSIEYENPDNEKVWKQIADVSPHTAIGSEEYSLISQLWSDGGVRYKCYGRRREFSFQLIDSAKYFLDNLNRICGNDYIPTEDDVLRVRVFTKCANVEEYSFTQDGIFRKVDVISMAGQCAERPTKWASWFCGVATFLYLVDVSKYDKVMKSPIDGKDMNSLEQSIKLFKDFLDYQLLTHVHDKLMVVLLFNKYDIFEEKITYSHLSDYFPAYEGPKQDSQSAMRFIREMFPTGEIGNAFVHCETLCTINSDNTRNISNMVNTGFNQEVLSKMGY